MRIRFAYYAAAFGEGATAFHQWSEEKGWDGILAVLQTVVYARYAGKNEGYRLRDQKESDAGKSLLYAA